MGGLPPLLSRHARFAFLLLACWLGMAGGDARAGAPALEIQAEAASQTLNGHLEALFDPTDALTRAEVANRTDWVEVGPHPYSKGLEPGTVWLRFVVQGAEDVPTDRLLHMGSGHVDDLTVWMQQGSAPEKVYHSGENVDPSDRVVKHFYPLFPLRLAPGEQVRVVAKLVDEGSINPEISIFTEDRFRDYTAERNWVSGLIVGMYALMALYSIVLFRRVRDPMMGWLTSLALTSLFHWVVLYGTDFALLLPAGARGWTMNRFIVVAYELSAFCTFQFYLTAIRGQRHHPRLTRVIQGIGWLGLLNALAIIVLPFVLSVRILYSGAIGLLLLAGLVSWRALRRDRVAVRLVMAVGIVLVGYLAALLTEEGMLPKSWISNHFVSIATLFQWLLLSEIVAFRVRMIEQRRREAKEAQKLEAQRTEEIRNAFGRYVAPDLAAKLLHDPDAMALGGRMQTVTILMSDLRGFTGLTDRLGPEGMCTLLNDYLGRMSEVIERHGGLINEFIGDAILTLFGTPYPGPEDELDACRCAIEMQMVLDRMNVELNERYGVRLEMGIGIHTGVVVVGNIGSAQRAKWGVIGGPVNMTGRIESLTVATEVLISSQLLERVAGRVETGPMRSVQVKGRSATLDVAQLIAIRDEPLRMPTQPTVEKAPTRPVDLPGVLQLFSGKILVDAKFPVQVEAIGEQEVVFQSARDYRPGTNVDLRVLWDGSHSTPIYAKLLDAGTRLEDGRFRLQATVTFMEPELRDALADPSERPASA